MGQVDVITARIEFWENYGNSNGNDKEYKVEAIWDNAVYAKESEIYLPGIDYQVL